MPRRNPASGYIETIELTPGRAAVFDAVQAALPWAKRLERYEPDQHHAYLYVGAVGHAIAAMVRAMAPAAKGHKRASDALRDAWDGAQGLVESARILKDPEWATRRRLAQQKVGFDPSKEMQQYPRIAVKNLLEAGTRW